MKKIILLFAFICGAAINVSAQKEKLDQLFDRYQDSDGITSIKISKPMFSMLNKLNLGDGELDQIKPLLAKINGLKMLIIEDPKSSSFKGIQGDISSSLKSLKYEELMSVNSKDNKIKFLSAGAKDGILDDLILNISSEGNSILMMLDGKISMDDVNKLVNDTQNFISPNPKNAKSSSNVTTRNSEVRQVGKFTGISVSTGIKVNFTQTDRQEIRVETDEDKLNYIKTEVKGGILNIYIDNPKRLNLNFNKIFVNVEAPELKMINVSSGSNLTVLNTLNADNIDLESTSGSLLNGDFNIKNKANLAVSSGSNMNVNVKSSELNFEGTSGSSATINGSAEQGNFELTSASNCNAQNLILQNVVASATSAANLSVNVSESLRADASSGGKIRYKGSPKITGDISKMSGGKLEKF